MSINLSPPEGVDYIYFSNLTWIPENFDKNIDKSKLEYKKTSENMQI